MLEDVHKILDSVDNDIELAAEKIHGGKKDILLYVISVGLDHIKAKRRANRRRELRREVQPQFRTGKTAGSIELTPKAKERLFNSTKELFGNDGWKIGDISLGDFTKEDLLLQAAAERKSAKGHILNADFYEALAEPMKDGQRVRQYWKPEDAAKIKGKIWKEGESRRPELK